MSSGNARGALRDVVVLDVARDAWFRPVMRGDDGPSGRAFHSACAVSDTRIVIACGRDGRVQFGDAWTLDAETWTWTRLTSATTTPRDFASVACIGNGQVLMFGGFDGKSWIGDVETLDVLKGSGGKWKTEEVKPAKLEAIDAVTSGGKTAPDARSGSAMTRYGPNLLVFGGQGANGAAFNDTWCLKREAANATSASSTPNWQWVKLVLRGSAPTARAGHAISVVSTRGGATPNVVVNGGVGDDGWLVKERVYFDDAHVLDGENARWQRLPLGGEGTGPSSRAYHTLTHVSQNKCLSFGGFNGTNACNDAWWLVVDDMEYADISSEARASPRALVDRLRERLPARDITSDAFEHDDDDDDVFRAHIASCDVEDVRIGHIPKMMCEYPVATAVKLGLPNQTTENNAGGPRGRFRHCEPSEMKLSDVSKALTELQGAYVANA